MASFPVLGYFWFANDSGRLPQLAPAYFFNNVAICSNSLLRNAAFRYIEVLSAARDHVMRVTVIKDWQVHSCFASHKLFFVVS